MINTNELSDSVKELRQNFANLKTTFNAGTYNLLQNACATLVNHCPTTK